MTSDKFIERVNSNTIDKSKYDDFTLNLNYCIGIQETAIGDKTYSINFYNGVYIAKSFNNIIDFLSLWQYLKSEILILEVPTKMTKETIGLFFEKDTSPSTVDICASPNQLKDIDYSNFSISDKHYLNNNTYFFSNDHYSICKEFLSKRIYPTPQLNLYIQKRFRTTEESLQRSALIAAWLTILVTIILTLMPHIYAHFDTISSENIQTNSVIESTESPLPDNSVSSNSNNSQ